MFHIKANLETFLCLLGVGGRVKPFEVSRELEVGREWRRGVKRREGKRRRERR
jgi:hypothetical protein